MDIKCPKCGEPWAIDELHDVYDDGDRKVSFKTAYTRFRKIGCAVFQTSHNKTPGLDTAAKAQVVMDILGDDVDGAASMLEDLDLI